MTSTRMPKREARDLILTANVFAFQILTLTEIYTHFRSRIISRYFACDLSFTRWPFTRINGERLNRPLKITASVFSTELFRATHPAEAANARSALFSNSCYKSTSTPMAPSSVLRLLAL